MMKWPGRRRKTPRAGWLKHVPDNELKVLIALADLGTLPPDARLLYADIQTRAETSMKATLALPSPEHVTVPPGMSFTDWLKFKWRSADASVRQTLRTVAEALGIDVPITRTRRVAAKDSSPAMRTKSEQHPKPPRPRPAEIPAEAEEPEEAGYHDPPQWHDDHADGWTPCESLHDAMHPEDRGWN